MTIATYDTNSGKPIDSDRFRRLLGPIADELEDAAANADDPAHRDVYAVLAALANGGPIPKHAAERIAERAEER